APPRRLRGQRRRGSRCAHLLPAARYRGARRDRARRVRRHRPRTPGRRAAHHHPSARVRDRARGGRPPARAARASDGAAAAADSVRRGARRASVDADARVGDADQKASRADGSVHPCQAFLMSSAPATASAPANPRSRVVVASLIGTTIEFYDFYVYATAAVLVFPHLFFPTGDETTALLSSFAVFGAAMVARPLGAVFFGHLGDKRGRKVTLVGALLTMGIATFLIGLLPTYTVAGWIAPLLLVV